MCAACQACESALLLMETVIFERQPIGNLENVCAMLRCAIGDAADGDGNSGDGDGNNGRFAGA